MYEKNYTILDVVVPVILSLFLGFVIGNIGGNCKGKTTAYKNACAQMYGQEKPADSYTYENKKLSCFWLTEKEK